jgi:TolB-like protein/Tfp pilus assembly protein PilF
VVAAILLGYRSSGTVFGYKIGGPGGDDKSIAVLPFDNFSKDKDDEYLSDGITEDITMNLAKIKELTVISRTSVMGYKHSSKKIKEIAKELGVKYILEGSVRKIGERVRIVSQLIDAPNDKHIWSDSYDREMEDLFDIQADVSKEIANAMEAKLTDKTVDMIDMAPTDNMEAYILYQRARSYYGMYTNDANETAITLFKEALDIDKNYALAYSGLSDCYGQRNIRFNFGQEWIDSALVAADLALKLNPNLAEAYKAKGLAYMALGDNDKSGEFTIKALELNPGYHMAVANYGIYLQRKGELFEAKKYLDKSIRLNPTSTSTETIWLSNIYSMIDEPTIANTYSLNAIKYSPNVNFGYSMNILLHLNNQEFVEAEKTLNLYLINIGKNKFWTAIKGGISYYKADYKSAETLFTELINRKNKWKSSTFGLSNELLLVHTKYLLKKPYENMLNEGISSYESKIFSGADLPYWMIELSALYALKNDINGSLDWLEKGVENGFRDRIYLKNSLFDNLRNQDRFKMVESEIDIFIQQEKLKFLRAGVLN